MHSSQRVLLAINVVGGAAVLGSYAQGLTTHPGLQNALWGGVPETIQTPYTAWMFVAAAGYFAFSYFLLLRTNPDEVRVAGRFGYYLFSLLYGGILIPSALWMPLTTDGLTSDFTCRLADRSSGARCKKFSTTSPSGMAMWPEDP